MQTMLRMWVVLLLAVWAVLPGCSRGISVEATSRPVAAHDGYALTTYAVFQKGRPPGRSPRGAVFYVHGSENQTVLGSISRMASFTSMGMPVYLLERRGVTNEGVVDPRAALEGCTREVRVLDQCAVIDSYLSGLDTSVPVLLIGSSEGGDVAAEVAARRPRVTHLMLLGCGGGMTQADELRMLVARYPGTFGVNSVDELDTAYEDIRANPDSDRAWLGHPYRRWSSFLWSPPVRPVRTLKIPVFLAHGRQDRSVPVESARMLASAVQGDVDLTYHEYPGVDHRFRDTHGRSIFPRLEVDGVRWLADHGLLTSVEAAIFERRVRRKHPDLTTDPEPASP